MIDQFSDKIIDFQIVQVSEVTSSNAMEREGFKRCMENIHDRGANIKVVATDRHVSIRSDMKKIFHICNTSSMFGMWQKVSPKNSQKRPRGGVAGCTQYREKISSQPLDTEYVACISKEEKSLHEQCSCYFSFGKIPTKRCSLRLVYQLQPLHQRLMSPSVIVKSLDD